VQALQAKLESAHHGRATAEQELKKLQERVAATQMRMQQTGALLRAGRQTGPWMGIGLSAALGRAGRGTGRQAAAWGVGCKAESSLRAHPFILHRSRQGCMSQLQRKKLHAAPLCGSSTNPRCWALRVPPGGVVGWPARARYRLWRANQPGDASSHLGPQPLTENMRYGVGRVLPAGLAVKRLSQDLEAGQQERERLKALSEREVGLRCQRERQLAIATQQLRRMEVSAAPRPVRGAFGRRKHSTVGGGMRWALTLWGGLRLLEKWAVGVGFAQDLVEG
jgi:hypothetical protein